MKKTGPSAFCGNGPERGGCSLAENEALRALYAQLAKALGGPHWRGALQLLAARLLSAQVLSPALPAAPGGLRGDRRVRRADGGHCVGHGRRRADAARRGGAAAGVRRVPRPCRGAGRRAGVGRRRAGGAAVLPDAARATTPRPYWTIFSPSGPGAKRGTIFAPPRTWRR